jgi:hypothetical protein
MGRWADKEIDMDEQFEANAVSALAAEVRELRAEVARLTAETAGRPAPPAPTGAAPAPTSPTSQRGPVSRRGLLMGAAGAAAAGAVVLATGAAPAAADNQGESWTLGDYTNQANQTTGLTATTIGASLLVNNPGAGSSQAAILGLNHGVTPPQSNAGGGAVTGISTGENSVAVLGMSDGLESTGVSGTAETGGLFTGTVVGGHGNSTTPTGKGLLGSNDNGIGVQGTSANGTAGQFTSNHAALNLSCSSLRGAPTLDEEPHAVGDLVVDVWSDLWYCCVAGTPGTWRKLAGAGASGAFYVLSPAVRVYDSRPGFHTLGGPQTKLAANTSRVVYVNPGGVASNDDGMTAVMLTVMLVNTAPGNGNLTIWPDLTKQPATNAMVWGGSAGRFSTLAVAPVGGRPAGLRFLSSLATDLVVDVVGYWH